jgi:hypothetical protein
MTGHETWSDTSVEYFVSFALGADDTALVPSYETLL